MCFSDWLSVDGAAALGTWAAVAFALHSQRSDRQRVDKEAAASAKAVVAALAQEAASYMQLSRRDWADEIREFATVALPLAIKSPSVVPLYLEVREYLHFPLADASERFGMIPFWPADKHRAIVNRLEEIAEHLRVGTPLGERSALTRPSTK